MSLNAMIISTLNQLNVPVSFQAYSGKASTYITFFEYNQSPALNADDSEEMTTHSIQVDVWSNKDYTSLVEQVKNSLTAIGFRRTTETEFYENNIKVYHKVLRFNFVQ